MRYKDGFDCPCCEGHVDFVEDVQVGGEFKSVYTCNNDDCLLALIYIHWEVKHDKYEDAVRACDRIIGGGTELNTLDQCVGSDAGKLVGQAAAGEAGDAGGDDPAVDHTAETTARGGQGEA